MSSVSIVSEFVATQIAVKCGPDFVKSLMVSTGALQNPVLYGWLLELWFFASIAKGGFEHYDNGNKTYKWEESDCLLFDPLHVNN